MDKTYLSTSHQVSACGNDGDRILLNGRGSSVTSVADVLEKHRVQRGVRKLSDRLWHTSTSGLDGNIVVLLEVDTGLLLGRIVVLAIELLLHADVAAAGDVLAVLPDSETKGLTGTTIPAGGTSTLVAIGLRAVAPSTSPSAAAASGAAEATSSTSEGSVSSRSTTVTAARRRSGRAGVSPAVPVKLVSVMYDT